jgi:thiosulfate/3-mercaptopyruvate sulfurtransferase
MELPSDEALRNLLGTFGIHPSSRVVVVSGTETDFSRADATRVAWTCKVAGVESVAVLDGGYSQWVADGGAVSTDPFSIRPIRYRGTIDRSSSISRNEVLSKIGKATILDARTPGDYFGVTSPPGHIMTAVNLPAPWAFSDSGTYLEKATLQRMAEGVLGSDKSREVIVYCGVGGYASTWWYLLTQMLGYRNVKLYDGSIEDWIKDPDAPVQSYSWH